MRLLVSQFLRFFTNNSGWTLPALFAILRDLRDLAFDVRALPLAKLRAEPLAGGRASTGFKSKE
jgi:COP9 signalosome complex subunit 12